jgi:hypothetical protein
VVLVLTLAALASTEVVLRLLDVPRGPAALALVDVPARDRVPLVPDARTFWRFAASAPFEVNRAGLRGRDPDARKSERHFRIAVVGDGTACGMGLDLDDSFAMRLERAAQQEAPGARLDTAILAGPGFTSFQALRLWQQLGPAFAPDLVVLYCGAWADFQPAAMADAEVAAAVEHPPRWRLLRLLRRLWPAAARAGDGGPRPRVSLADFTRNLDQLVGSARQAGAEVCVVVPALAGDLERQHPDAARYRDALQQAVAGKTVLLNADALIRAYEQAVPAAVCADVGTSHGFRDGVHLSAPAHALLADLLLPRVRSHPRFVQLAARPRPEAPRVRAVEPPAIEALAGTEITVRGTGFAGAPGLRLWLGAESVTTLQVVDDQSLKAQVPLELVPGSHPLALGTESGLAPVPPDVALTVEAPRLDAALRRAGDRLELTLSGRAPPGGRVQVWVSPAGRAHAVVTPAGPFWLQAGPHSFGKPERAPFCWSALPLPSFTAAAGADATWQVTAPWQPEHAAGSPTAAFQGLVRLPGDTGRAVSTAPVVRVVPR